VSTPLLNERVVLITGASGTLGSATALACAQAGATVVLLGRNISKLERLYDRLTRTGACPLLYPLDLQGASPDDYAELAQRLQSELGRLDGIVHCAADFPGLTPFELADPLALARIIHVNLTARAWLTQACLPLLRQQNDAAVVLVLDELQRVGQAYWGAYSMAQYGQRGLLESLHHELQNSSVRVCGLQPPPLRSPLRARAFSDEGDVVAVSPEASARACVQLLSTDGMAWRGKTQVITS